ncbi:hypothetical protein [Amycolatopsis pigmentata]|uniref:Uncharacterized protein n=1 Tax=Amycolatopsis pigmentata TaxID=450801 RepID=A0ABW5G6Z8_9PSEU
MEEADRARSVRRSAAAQRVGELAHRRALIVQQLFDIERELGDVLAESSDVMEIDELARFTDLPAADLTQWLSGRKTSRTKRKKSIGDSPGAKNAMNRRTSTTTSPSVQVSTPHERSKRSDSTANAHALAGAQ